MADRFFLKRSSIIPHCIEINIFFIHWLMWSCLKYNLYNMPAFVMATQQQVLFYSTSVTVWFQDGVNRMKLFSLVVRFCCWQILLVAFHNGFGPEIFSCTANTWREARHHFTRRNYLRYWRTFSTKRHMLWWRWQFLVPVVVWYLPIQPKLWRWLHSVIIVGFRVLQWKHCPTIYSYNHRHKKHKQTVA